MSTFLQHFRSFSSKGFTLIELMMVIAIITILTGVFLLQNRQFDSSTLLRSLAYKTALSIRQAQTYGTSVRFAGSTLKPASAYGVYISTGSNSQYYLFADNDDNRAYSSDEIVETFKLGNNYTISKFCATRSGSTLCSTDSGGPTSLTILYIRPSSDACFETDIAPILCVSTDSGTDYTNATVQLRSAGGVFRTVTITNTGQISVGSAGI